MLKFLSRPSLPSSLVTSSNPGVPFNAILAAVKNSGVYLPSGVLALLLSIGWPSELKSIKGIAAAIVSPAISDCIFA